MPVRRFPTHKGLISGVHGDEISSVHTIQTVMSQLDPAQMSGTVLQNSRENWVRLNLPKGECE
jgi:hypothetical protein